MSKPFTCYHCKKETKSKDGIEGSGPYFVRCALCDAKHEIRQSSFDSGAPVDFEIVGLFKGIQ